MTHDLPRFLALATTLALTACQATAPTAGPPAAPTVLEAPPPQAPTTTANLAAVEAAPTIQASIRPKEPRDTSPVAVGREAAFAKAQAAGIGKVTFGALLQADAHERSHKVPTPNRVWVFRDATMLQVCIDATTGERLAH